jgi:CheY-like chemotaxis protein
MRESLEQINLASERAANLTRQLLTFSRQQAFRPKPLDLRTTLGPVGKMLRRLIGEHIALEIRTHSEPLFVSADIGMIEQIVMNLAVNSRDAMPAGGRLEIGVSEIEVAAAEAKTRHAAAYPGKFAVLSVADSGIGLAPETMNHLFEPFFTTKEVGRGTGLGLATVYGIVQLHKGWIEVASTLGEGATFRIFFPMVSPDQPGATADVQANVPGRGEGTVLVVEDEPAVRMLICRSLAHYGYRVLEASNAHEALEIWEPNRRTIDVLFTDMVMPGGMSGSELAARLRQQNPDLKVIVASGYSGGRGGNQADGSGIEYLAKPFDGTTLTQAVRRLIDRDRLGRL